MAKAALKTTVTTASVEAFIDKQPAEIADDCRMIIAMMKKVTGEEPIMWGASMVGFGKYAYKYATGREGEWMLTGFSPRKSNMTVYIFSGLDKAEAQLKKLGKCSTGKGCLYFKRLADVDAKVLEDLVAKGVKGLEKMRVR
jgi:hypothetical protein